MYKIGILNYYFGTFPNYIDFFWKSVENNASIDFILYTDIDCKHSAPHNVRVINIVFEDFKKKIQSKFDFEIADKNAYDLCSIRAMAGYIFENELAGYDFWGFSDFDVIFGDIRAFFTDEILSTYDKILSHGHLTLMRNNETMRYLFMKSSGISLDYKKVLRSSLFMGLFEEYPYGISLIAKEQGVRVYEAPIFADLDVCSFTFRKIYSYYENVVDDDVNIIQYFEMDKGKLYDCIIDGEVVKRMEILYVHLQKRMMDVTPFSQGGYSTYKIIPNRFTDEPIDIEEIKAICDIRKNAEYARLKVISSNKRGRNGRWKKIFRKHFLRDYFWKRIYWYQVKKVNGLPYYRSSNYPQI